MAEQTPLASHGSPLFEEIPNGITNLQTKAAADSPPNGPSISGKGSSATMKESSSSSSNKQGNTSKEAASTSKEAASTSKEAASTSKKATPSTSKDPSTSKTATPSTSKDATPSTSKAATPSTSKDATPSTSKDAGTSKAAITSGIKYTAIGGPKTDKSTGPYFQPSSSLATVQQHLNKSKSTCPFNSSDWIGAGHMPGAAARVKRDIATLYSQPLPGVFFVADEKNLMCVHSMMIGNFDTPYEGGFFHFYSRFGPLYPFEPPRVSAMSCFKFGHKVRFNPNMYEDGTVCLSILGTWSGPSWTAANNLSGLLLSIQSLFCDQALCNEPGYAELRDTGDQKVEYYDVYVRHETLRVAVLETIKFAKEFNIPADLIRVMKSSFMEFYNYYMTSCETHKKYDQQKLRISLIGKEEFIPNFTKLKEDLEELHRILTDGMAEEGECSGGAKLIQDNALACPSSSADSSLSELSDSDVANVPNKTSAHRLSLASFQTKQQDSTEDNTASGSSSQYRSALDWSSEGLPSIVNKVKTLAGGSPKTSKGEAKTINTKLVSAVKIDSAYCEKLFREVNGSNEIMSAPEDALDECIDYMANSDSDNDDSDITDSEEEMDEDECTEKKLSLPEDTSESSNGESSSKDDTVSVSPDLWAKTSQLSMEAEEIAATSNSLDKVNLCHDDCSGSDSSGRGCKREATGLIKRGGGEKERASKSSSQ